MAGEVLCGRAAGAAAARADFEAGGESRGCGERAANSGEFGEDATAGDFCDRGVAEAAGGAGRGAGRDAEGEPGGGDHATVAGGSAASGDRWAADFVQLRAVSGAGAEEAGTRA